MQPHINLMLQLCRTPLEDSAWEKVRTIAADETVSWDLFFVNSRHWQIEPVVMTNLREVCGDILGSETLERAATREKESKAFALRHALITVGLVHQLGDAGIPSLVLKGAATGVSAYGNPALRSSGDIDLLVHRADLEKSSSLIESKGFIPLFDPGLRAKLLDGQHALEFAGPKAKIELHTSLLSRHLRLTMDEREVWETSRRIDCASAQIQILSRGAELLFLCAHGAKHAWLGLKWICDVSQLLANVNEVDVRQALRLATVSRSLLILGLGLNTAEEILGANRDGFPDSGLLSRSRSRPFINVVRRQIGLDESYLDKRADILVRLDPALGPLVYWARVRENPIDKIMIIAGGVRGSHDGSSGFLGTIARPVKLVSRAVRRFRNLEWWSPPSE